MIASQSSGGRSALILVLLAVLWSVGLLVAALVVPVYGSATLVGENGTAVLFVLAVPTVLSLVVWMALWRRCSRGGRVSSYVTWGCISLLSAFCIVGILSVGVFVVPVAVLLASAASRTPSGGRPGPRLA